MILRGERGGERAHHVRGGTLGIGVQGVEAAMDCSAAGYHARPGSVGAGESAFQRGQHRASGSSAGTGDAVKI